MSAQMRFMNQMKRVIDIQPGAAGDHDVVVPPPVATPAKFLGADLERLIQAINETALPEEDKTEAKTKLMNFLTTPAAVEVLRDAIPQLRQMMGF